MEHQETPKQTADPEDFLGRVEVVILNYHIHRAVVALLLDMSKEIGRLEDALAAAKTPSVL